MKLSDWTGPIINDKKDSRLFIPKPFPGIGWTFNFGQPLTWVFTFLLILAIVLCAVFIR
jgi:uncharacterized membrane protein